MSRRVSAALLTLFAMFGLGLWEYFSPSRVSSPFFACTKDDMNSRDLSGSMVNDPALTNAKCKSKCAAGHFAFAGTQNGNVCFCGNSFGKYGPATCNSVCAGNRFEICGGTLANTVSPTGFTAQISPSTLGGVQCNISMMSDDTSWDTTEFQQWVVQRLSADQTNIIGNNGKRYDVQWSTTGTVHHGNSFQIGPYTYSYHFIARSSGVKQEETPITLTGTGPDGNEFIKFLPIDTPTNMTPSVGGKRFTVGPACSPKPCQDLYDVTPSAGSGYQLSGGPTGSVDCQWSLMTTPPP